MSDIPPLPPSSAAPPLSTSDGGVDWEALARYVAGESGEHEADVVRRWLTAHPAEQAFAAALERAFTPAPSEVDPAVDVDGALARVRTRLEREGTAGSTVPRTTFTAEPSPRRARSRRLAAAIARGEAGSRRPLWPVVALAAAVVVLFAALFVWRPRSGERVAGTPAGAREFVTGVGERDSVLLGDGTRVVLGPGSRLRVAAGYGVARRDVELRGDGYFEVRHDASRPFAVRAGVATIRDVGTTFAVHSDTALRVRVVVTSGAVRVRTAHASANLAAGDVATLGSDGAIRTASGAATADDLAWTHGRLVFREAPMDEVGADLQRWYGVRLVVRDRALAGRHLTASFQGEPVDRVLDVVGLALGAEVERHGDSAVVSARATGAAR